MDSPQRNLSLSISSHRPSAVARTRSAVTKNATPTSNILDLAFRIGKYPSGVGEPRIGYIHNHYTIGSRTSGSPTRLRHNVERVDLGIPFNDSFSDF